MYRLGSLFIAMGLLRGLDIAHMRPLHFSFLIPPRVIHCAEVASFSKHMVIRSFGGLHKVSCQQSHQEVTRLQRCRRRA